MKKSFTVTIYIFAVVLLVMSNQPCFAQSVRKQNATPVFTQSIGVQFNPYLDQSFINGDIKKYVFAARYIFENKEGISFGPEFSGNYGHNDALKWYTLNLGAFFRYTFLYKKKVRPFVEVSAYYQWNRMTVTDTTYDYVNNGQKNDIENHKFGYYVAPGISIPLYKRKLTLALFIKCSTDTFLNGRNFVPSIRIVYHF
jgi:hypothetical protein